MYIQADVGDLNSMKEGLSRVKERFGGINGVIHAAGIAGSQNIFEKEVQSFQKVLNPKIKGTLVLDELLGREPLDFICYFSSSAAILGDFGTCDYAVANRFLMAYAHYRNQSRHSGKTLVINWPLWRDGGMGVDDAAATRMYLKSSGQRFLEAEEGLAVFERILSQNYTQHLVLVGQPSRLHRFLDQIGGPSLKSLLAVSDPVFAANHASDRTYQCGRPMEMQGWSLAQCMEWDLQEQIGKLLKISRDKLNREESLADFGFDSISLAQLANSLTGFYRITVTPALFFGYATIEKLTHYFLTEYQQSIQEFYREDVNEVEQMERPEPPKVPLPEIEPKLKLNKSRFATAYVASDLTEPIAIIGMSGRFPGSGNIDELWEVLNAGRDMVCEIPPGRFDWRQYYGDPARTHGREPGKMNSKWCGSLTGVNEFDPLFFEISPQEAEIMDPRQRLLLQEAWKALEDAGYGAEQIKSKKIGMFVGVEQGDYQLLVKKAGTLTSNNNAILASRLAYFLNLNGPVMAIDTACSSGLVAAHQAVLSLHNNECDTAIAAGVNLLLTPAPYIGMSQAGMLSEDGKCYAFDQRANGLVPGEAVAVVILKRLSRAEADGDPVYAIIRGSGINYDGKTNGITAPSGIAQIQLLKTIYDQYRIESGRDRICCDPRDRDQIGGSGGDQCFI